MAKFFWGKISGVKGKHWVSWDTMCYPILEGGIGLHSLFDIYNALFAKLWWKLGVETNSMWDTFMWNKYCKKEHPLLANKKGGLVFGRNLWK